MSEPTFDPPSLESMNVLLPAFDFGEVMSSNHLGAVYFATQKSLDRKIALKVFSPALGSDESFKNVFTQSSSLVAGIRHSNLIGFYNSGIVDGMPYIVMEFVPGKSLARSTQGRVVNLDQSLAIIQEICKGIEYAHQKNLIHGNLSPMSILLNEKASPKIGNFGLGLSIHTLPDTEVPEQFTAPEVLAGERPTKASDLYSIAAIFFELITGHAYSPDGPSASSLTDCKPAVDDVIRKAGATDPTQRGDMAEFLKSLQEASGKGLKKVVSGEKKSPSLVPTPLSAAPAKVGGGLDRKLVMKIAIIIMLLFAINLAWKQQKAAAAKRDLEAKQQEQREQQKAIEVSALAHAEALRKKEAEARRLAQLARQQAQNSRPKVVESPMESLERLRDSLKKGSRVEMPLGSVQKGDSHYFLVTNAMTWTDAATFAEAMGGHLAIPDSDLGWRKEEQFKESRFWVGVARSGPDRFTLVNGSLWSSNAEISGGGDFVYSDESLNLQTADARKTHPFVIQWHADASNPATLEAQFTAAAASMKGSNPVYPPGTVTLGGRRYLPVVLSATWDEARAKAESVGGNLLVISSSDESSQVEKIAARLAGRSAIWLGGHLPNDQWLWVTKEPWNGVAWTNEGNAAISDSAMVIRAGKGLDALKKSKKAAGFIIEWSDDPDTNKGTANASPSSSKAITELAEKAKGLVISAGEKKEEDHVKNMHKFKWDLDTYLRPLKKSDFQVIEPEVEKLKGCVKDNRLYAETIKEAGVRSSTQMVKLADYHIGKQKEIDNHYIGQLATIHRVYLEKMGEILDQAKAARQVKVENDVSSIIDQANDRDAWLRSMGVTLDR